MTCHKDTITSKEHMNVKSEATKRRSRRPDAVRMKVLEKRLALADELARTPTTTVTLRLPAGLNQWLDGYVHGAWPARVRKQELVVEALRLLIARRGGPGEDSFSTDLLAERQGQR
jgi:hypothetical protein